MNSNEVIIRFNTQRSSGEFYNDGFPFWEVIDISKQKTEEYIKSLDEWVDAQAEILNKEFDLSKLKGKKVLYLGDSITADRLSYRALTTKACDFNAYNTSISGSTSSDAVRFIFDSIQQFKPEIISIMTGGNDSIILNKKSSIVGREDYRRNISLMLEAGVNSGAKVIVSTPTPIDERLFPMPESGEWRTNTNENIDAYAGIVREEAKRYNVLLNDANSLVKRLNIDNFTEDGVHLTKEIHVEIAKQWIKTILNQ